MVKTVDEWTPLHTRIISHRIGDGTINFYKRVVWDNKKIDEFISLCNFLGVKLWKPIKGDSYGTKKMIIPNYLFKRFSEIYKKDYERLKKDSTYLLDAILELPEEHRLQTILSLIVDDGSCSSWMLVAFEDSNKIIVEKAQMLWESVFPNTSSIKFYITKRGTKVYYLFVNRDGIVELYKKLEKIHRRYGHLAGLWWKEKMLKKRYLKAISHRGKKYEETRKLENEWKNKILKFTEENKSITISITQKILGLSRDRAYRILSILKNEGQLKVEYRGCKSKFVLS